MFLKVVDIGADCFPIVSSYRVVPIGPVELLSGEKRHEVGINWSQSTILLASHGIFYMSDTLSTNDYKW